MKKNDIDWGPGIQIVIYYICGLGGIAIAVLDFFSYIDLPNATAVALAGIGALLLNVASERRTAFRNLENLINQTQELIGSGAVYLNKAELVSKEGVSEDLCKRGD